MRGLALVLLILVLGAPTASAWRADVLQPFSGEPTLRSSLLLAGDLNATAPGAPYGAPLVQRAGFGDQLTIQFCPDQPEGAAALDPTRAACTATHTEARLRVLAGGMIVVPQVDANVTLDVPAGTAALGGVNMSLNRFPAGPGIYAGGDVRVRAEGSAFILRPLGGANASLEVRSREGFQVYNGTSYTLRLQGAEGAFLEARGAFLVLPEGSRVAMARAPVRVAEAGLGLEDLFRLQRALVEPELADRRADLTEAFGPFQVVPALLDGALAARANLTLNGEPRTGFTLLSLDDLTLAPEGGNWTGSGNATYVVLDDTVSPEPGHRTSLPLVGPALLLVVALAARWLTPRQTPPRSRRVLAFATSLACLLLVAVLGAWIVGLTLGIDPLQQRDDLSLRSQVQLGLLVLGMLLLAHLWVGLAARSLARSILAGAHRPAAVVAPIVVGYLACALFLLWARPAAVAFVAKVVRL